MFNIRDEGEVVTQGFNFYSMNSSSIGFILRIRDRMFVARYSKVVKRFYCNTAKVIRV